MNSLNIAECFLTMASFMDGLRDCLADGWTVELGELGYFTPLSFYIGFSYCIFNDGITPTVTWRISTEFPLHAPCALLPRLTGRSVKQAITDLNQLIEDGVLMGHGEGRNVVYAKQLPKT